MKRLVCGVGLNDADYQVYVTEIKNGKQNILWRCQIYKAWTSMLTRCYSTKFQKRCPTYIGCSVANEWHSFSAFRTWALNHDWEGNQLDKDILVAGNKVYSPDTCVFVSRQLNMFINDSGSTRGEWPTGVSWNKYMGKLKAYCGNPFTEKKEHLGYFTCPDAAHDAWRKRKHELACVYAEQQTDPRIAKALRRLFANHGAAQ